MSWKPEDVKRLEELVRSLKELNMELDDLLRVILEEVSFQELIDARGMRADSLASDILRRIGGLRLPFLISSSEGQGPSSLITSFISFLGYLGVLEIVDNVVRLGEIGRELQRIRYPEMRGVMLTELLAKRSSGFARLLGLLKERGRISKGDISSARDPLERSLIEAGFILLSSYKAVAHRDNGLELTKRGSQMLSKVDRNVLITGRREEVEGTACGFFDQYLHRYLEFRRGSEFKQLMERKERLLDLGGKLANPDLLKRMDDEGFRGILSELISSSFTMEWAGESKGGFLGELLESSYFPHLREVLLDIAERKSKATKRDLSSSLFQLLQGVYTQLATEILSLIHPLGFAIYDDHVYRLIASSDELQLIIFDRQAPYHEGLGVDYYERFCDYVRRLRLCLRKIVGEELDNLDVYLFMRYVEEQIHGTPREGAEEQEWMEELPVGSTKEILDRLGLSYEVYTAEEEEPGLSGMRFGEKFPWIGEAGEKGKRLRDVEMYRHQFQAEVALSSGRNVVLISGTGSGKTEAWALHAIDRKKKVLAIYPTLALSGDQMLRLKDYFKAVGEEYVFKLDSKVVRKYKGRKGDRRLLKKRINLSQVIVTNPAFLMADLKRMAVSEGYLERFLQDVDMIVIDDMDFLGSSGASLLVGGILSLLYDHFFYSKKPQLVVLTATVGNPEELARALTELNGRDTRVIRGRPLRVRNVTYLLTDEEAGIKLAPLLASIVVSDPSGVTLVFTKTIEDAEKLARNVVSLLPEGLRDTVKSHHHLIAKEERERIERGAREGSIRMIVTPKTLIQGIDIGTVKRVVHHGLPLDVREYRQREGRKGRRKGMGTTESIIVPLSKWDRKLMETGSEYLFRWASQPPENIIVNPGNKYVKLFKSLYKLRSPFLVSKLEEDEVELLRKLDLMERVEFEGMLIEELSETAVRDVWRKLSFYGYGPPYGFRKHYDYDGTGEPSLDEEISLSDLIERFQPGSIDYSSSLIVSGINWKKGIIHEESLKKLLSSSTPVGTAMRKAKLEYERTKESWGEVPDFFEDFYYGKISSKVDMLVKPPKEVFGLLIEIPLSVKWIFEGSKPVEVEVDGVTRKSYQYRIIDLGLETTGAHRMYTYGVSYPLDPQENAMGLRLGMAYLLSLLKLELNYSPNLLRYEVPTSSSAGQLVIWEPNPVGIVEMPELWAELDRAVRRHEPDHLTEIYMWAIDREATDLWVRKGGRWSYVRKMALRALRYIRGREVPTLEIELGEIKPADLRVVSFEITDPTPLMEGRPLAVLFDGQSFEHIEIPTLESLEQGELSKEDVGKVARFFERLSSYQNKGYKMVHFGRRKELDYVIGILGAYAEIKFEEWESEGRLVDLHEELKRSTGEDLLPIERVEGLLKGSIRRRVRFEDLLGLRASRNVDQDLVDDAVKRYAEDNAKSTYILYLAIMKR